MIEVVIEPIHDGLWGTVTARPGTVFQRGRHSGEVLMWLAGSSGWYLRSDELALALIDAVVTSFCYQHSCYNAVKSCSDRETRLERSYSMYLALKVL